MSAPGFCCSWITFNMTSRVHGPRFQCNQRKGHDGPHTAKWRTAVISWVRKGETPKKSLPDPEPDIVMRGGFS